MLPWGHLAVGYLLYTLWSRLRFRRPPSSGPTIALGVGTQFPDLVDKPLNLWLGIYDGRAIGHSLLTLVPLCLLVLVVAHRYGYTRYATAFGLGAITHPLLDARSPLLNGTVREEAGYLLWPVFPAPSYPEATVSGYLSELREEFAQIDTSSFATFVDNTIVFDSLLAAILIGIWIYDGYPGVRTLHRAVSRSR